MGKFFTPLDRMNLVKLICLRPGNLYKQSRILESRGSCFKLFVYYLNVVIMNRLCKFPPKKSPHHDQTSMYIRSQTEVPSDLEGL